MLRLPNTCARRFVPERTDGDFWEVNLDKRDHSISGVLISGLCALRPLAQVHTLAIGTDNG